MKKQILLFLLILLICLLPACGQTQNTENPPEEEIQSYPYETLNEEVSQLLSSDTMSNAEKSDLMAYLTSRQLARAEDYREKIKQAFRDKTEAAPELYADIGFSLADGIQSIDDYCAYLEKEYRDNLAFFRNCAAIRYDMGSAGSSYLAQKEYECAENYADKLEAIYEELTS